MKKRTRIDIYAAILNIVKRHSEGIRLTRISYGAGIPTDRARKFINQLLSAGLMAPSSENAAYYTATKHGRKFLEAYAVLKGYLKEMDENLSTMA
ncbi:MAG: winged helix-turn-helix domain-containing protein [Candidatus Hodarchaeota archaeon]